MSRARLIREIYDVAADCEDADWDGYGAKPVTKASADTAAQIVRSIPLGVPLPEPGPEPCGTISLDWYARQAHNLSVSAHANGRLPYAWLDDRDRGHDVAEFNGEFPAELLAIIKRIYAKEPQP